MESVDETADSPPKSPQYGELVEVITRAVAKLHIDWPAEKQTEPRASLITLFAHSAITSTPGPAFFPRSPHLGVEIVGEAILSPHLHSLC